MFITQKRKRSCKDQALMAMSTSFSPIFQSKDEKTIGFFALPRAPNNPTDFSNAGPSLAVF